jgi:hypothetical protein
METKERKRAVRRHHIARLKKARKNYWGYPNRYGTPRDEAPNAPEGMNAAQLGKVVQYPQVCSCASCCNVRRCPWMNYSERTRDEQRGFQNYREGLDEIFSGE